MRLGAILLIFECDITVINISCFMHCVNYHDSVLNEICANYIKKEVIFR